MNVTSPVKLSFKLILIGNSGVGKTAILRRLIDNVFVNEVRSTIGVDYTATHIKVGDRDVELQIWDTAGQERFRAIAKAYFRNAAGILLVFDITERSTYDALGGWLNDVHNLCEPDTVVTLIGNKADLAFKRFVSSKEAEQFAELHQMTYLETSALGGDNIEEAFQRTASAVVQKLQASARSPISSTKAFRPAEPRKESSCC